MFCELGRSICCKSCRTRTGAVLKFDLLKRRGINALSDLGGVKKY